MRVSRALANAAFDCLAPHRSTSVCSRAISACWRAATLARRASSAARGRHVLRVGALVLDDRADVGLAGPVEVEHAGDRLVEQLEVVGDHDERAPVGRGGTRAASRGRRCRGGSWARRACSSSLPREQDAGQLDPAALAAGQHADGPVGAVAAQAEAGEQAPGLGLGGVAAGVLEGVVGPAPPGDAGARRRAAPPWRARSFSMRATQLVEAPAAEHVGDGRDVVGHAVEARVLGQVAEGLRGAGPTPGLGLRPCRRAP